MGRKIQPTPAVHSKRRLLPASWPSSDSPLWVLFPTPINFLFLFLLLNYSTCSPLYYTQGNTFCWRGYLSQIPARLAPAIVLWGVARLLGPSALNGLGGKEFSPRHAGCVSPKVTNAGSRAPCFPALHRHSIFLPRMDPSISAWATSTLHGISISSTTHFLFPPRSFLSPSPVSPPFLTHHSPTFSCLARAPRWSAVAV